MSLTYASALTGKSIETVANEAHVQERRNPKRVGDKKSKRGGGKHAPKSTNDTLNSNSTKTIKTVLKEKVFTIRDSKPSIWQPQFAETFNLIEKKKDEFFRKTFWIYQLKQFAAIIPVLTAWQKQYNLRMVHLLAQCVSSTLKMNQTSDLPEGVLPVDLPTGCSL